MNIKCQNNSLSNAIHFRRNFWHGFTARARHPLIVDLLLSAGSGETNGVALASGTAVNGRPIVTAFLVGLNRWQYN